jgi:hypothetical protein
MSSYAWPLGSHAATENSAAAAAIIRPNHPIAGPVPAVT